MVKGRLWPLAVFVAFAGCAPASSDAPRVHATGLVATVAAEAKRKGEATATLAITFSSDGKDVSFDRIRQEYSAFLIRPTALNTVRTGQDRILTWHEFEVAERLTTKSFEPARCDLSPPRGIPTNPRNVALPLLSGTVTVDGVKITARTLESLVTFEVNRTYVVFVAACPNGVIRIPFGPHGVFSVGAGGSLVPMVDDQLGIRPFVDEILGFGTVARLRTKLSSS